MKINKKLLIKAIIYRAFAFIFIFLVSLILSKKIFVSVFIGILEILFKLLLYYIFDVLWNKITIKE